MYTSRSTFIFALLTINLFASLPRTSTLVTGPAVTSRTQPVEVAILVFGRTTQVRSLASLSYAEPAIKLAVDKVSEIYNGTFKFIYTLTTAHSCLVTANMSAEILAEWYYRLWAPGRVMVLVTPGDPTSECWTDAQTVYRLAASWNTLIMNTGGGVDLVGKRSLLPTTFSTASANMPSFAAVALNLIKLYKWSSVFIVHDVSANVALANKAAATQVFTALQTGAYGRVDSVLRNINSSGFVDYHALLTDFRSISRILFYYGRPVQLRELLITASSLKMTNGDFVYIGLQSMKAPSLYGNFTWRYGEDDDEIVQAAYRSVLMIEPLSATIPDGKKSANQYLLDQLELAFPRESALRHNLIYTNAKDLLPILLGSYTTILMICQVLLETWQDGNDLTNGSYLATRLLNRLFTTEVGDVFINGDGIRVENLVVSYTAAQSELREPFLVQYGVSQTTLKQVGAMINWPGGGWPPPSVPLCGFRNEKLFCFASSSATTGIIVGMALVALSGVMVILIAFRKLQSRKSQHWWIITHTLEPQRAVSSFHSYMHA
ncbi:hypothetical protein BV898_08782 [Hypsibius exemplaris]|uniref:Receptor ligand binding region domain-containing protein n=1 Tax=Hypsibius exemplaris TaxID=2072580 RepID=A0A1W0WPD5_HYPEX|nr:hypothetical protein BV898_08782 [Hypsibius exemplaris]